MAVTTLGAKALMSIVKIKENGVLQDFYVVRHNAYTNGRTLLLRRYIHSAQKWHSSAVNAYATCSLDAWFNGDYFNSLPADIRAQIAAVTFPYTLGNGDPTLRNLSRKVFALSVTEFGADHSGVNVEGTALANAATLRIATNSGGTATAQWTRSPNTNYTDRACAMPTTNWVTNEICTTLYCARPAFTLPASIWVHDDGTIAANLTPTTPSSITVPATLKGGENCTVSWGAATDPDGNLSGYRLERSVNGGAWTEVYSGAALSSVQTITKGWITVAYRVRAVDAPGEFSGYATSPTRTVINNNPPTTPGTPQVDRIPRAGKTITVTCAPSTDPDGDPISYVWERRVDSDVYQQIGITTGTSATDTVPAAGLYYQVRVKAADNQGGESAYATGTAAAISYNDPPQITGEDKHLGDVTLTGIAYPYTVTDDQSASCAVVITVNGAEYERLTAVCGTAYTLDITGERWRQILNAANQSITITATDGHGDSTVRTLTFTKRESEIDFTLKTPRESQEKPYRIAVGLSAKLDPAATLLVEACNNALDPEPQWEDVTAAVLANRAHIFENGMSTAGWAVDVHVSVKRGPALEECNISGFTYAFETVTGSGAQIAALHMQLEQNEQLLDTLLTEIIPGLVEG